MNIEQTIRENIDKTVHLSLGTSRDNKPWVCEVHFAYDNDLNLYFRSLSTRRHSQEIADNPSVSGTIVRQHAVDEYPLGIYFEGTAEQLGPGEPQNKAFEVLHGRVNAADDAVEEAARPDGHQFYKITVRKWYVFGKLEADKGGLKYELDWNGGNNE